MIKSRRKRWAGYVERMRGGGKKRVKVVGGKAGRKEITRKNKT
jgi:hypothetical protein